MEAKKKYRLAKFLKLHCSLAGLLLMVAVSAAHSKTVSIAFFESGDYITHGLTRQAIREHLDVILPDGTIAEYRASWYVSAGWSRDSSRVLAARLAADREIDLVFTLGPWVAEDLLAENFSKPIVALGRFDPLLEGLLARNRRPIADNLTVQAIPSRLESDLAALAQLVRPQKVGFLHFPTANETDSLFFRIQQLGRQYGFEATTATGETPQGTYAYFRAVRALPEDIDAIYMTSAYGLSADIAREFFSQASDAGRAVFISDGRFMVERGALASNQKGLVYAAAADAALRAKRILTESLLPADIPITFDPPVGLTINIGTAAKLNKSISDYLLFSAETVGRPISEAPPVTLFDALHAGAAQNSAFLAGHEVLQSAIDSARPAASWLNPRVSLYGDITYHDDNTVHNTGDVYSNSRARIGLTLQQTLLSIENLSRNRLSSQYAHTLEQEQQLRRQELETAITLAFLQLAASSELLEFSISERRLVDRLHEAAYIKHHADPRFAPDLFYWTSAQLQAMDLVAQARVAYLASTALFNSLLNRPSNFPLSIDTSVINDRPTNEVLRALAAHLDTESQRAAITEKFLALAVEKSPEFRVSASRTTFQRTRAASRNGLPFPTIGFHANFSFVDSLAKSLPYEEKNPVWSAGATLTWPLIGFKPKTSDLTSVEEFRRDALRLRSMADIQENLSRLHQGLLSLGALQEAANLAGESLPIMVTEYETGSRSLGDLAAVVRSLGDSRNNFIERRFSVLSSATTLARLVGLSSGETNTAPWVLLAQSLR